MRNSSLLPRQLAFTFYLLAMVLALSASNGLTAAEFINPASYNIPAIIPPSPEPGTTEYKIDTGYLKNARATSTKEVIEKANIASHDSVFDYSQTLGSWFNSRDLPKTTALFNEVDRETKEAIELAKHYFVRARPIYWHETGSIEKSNGYSYPSGHTTRAFVWADLLSNALPDERQALHLQARQKAWYRVILGRHFPADVRAGKIFGKFLAKQFLLSPAFQKEWAGAAAEIQSARKQAAPRS
jgi:acid phosphatase (class A)